MLRGTGGGGREELGVWGKGGDALVHRAHAPAHGIGKHA